MTLDNRVIILGEDILDPYGGAFKVTRGLSSSFMDRVITTPISEAGFVGVAAGLALRGYRPVVEIMFGDFVTLIADQLINHISKFRWMYNNQVSVPIVIRTPMGGRRGYGPTHSQSLEKLFIGVPGLRITAPTAFGHPGDLLLRAILENDDPVLFIENKLLYQVKLHDEIDLHDYIIKRYPEAYLNSDDFQKYSKGDIQEEAFIIVLRDAPPPSVTIVAYGYMAELAREAMQRLAYEYEIFSELVIPTQISPLDINPILLSIKRTGRLLVIEEGTLTLGWGAEVISQLIETNPGSSRIYQRLAAIDLPIPAATSLESIVLPDIQSIIDKVTNLIKLQTS
jgi:pyruvate/2-oxoglutarate/acetoin dehydrogenase E1 component